MAINSYVPNAFGANVGVPNGPSLTEIVLSYAIFGFSQGLGGFSYQFGVQPKDTTEFSRVELTATEDGGFTEGKRLGTAIEATGRIPDVIPTRSAAPNVNVVARKPS